ncbi:tetratricopeptide repeat protein [Colwellia sp. 4_MG-2023]|uniref:tetratricopeptide repeat protein n=1 Tax=unclassified Colwellia TaxID=196834 RepID=UPI0026E3E393|nr:MULTISPECIES: tetratricopeptide repeat protein [unclassified Colwellia]MDO6505990.1 tetratricopeptide repeat protein [Colwellia sp. 5_MG-2023]MDO6554950.1 tetratricopeptide repeat protein [Colwellia sp. 4_MG-2023]
MRQLSIITFLMVFSFSFNAFSQSTAFDTMTRLAEKGIPTQQYNLGFSYFYGQGGVPQNTEKGLFWLNKAAEGNSAAVHYKIGRLYETGQIFNKDLNKAFEYYLLSGQGGDPYGLTNLSVMYIEGKGVEKNIEEGIKWAEKAANKGFVNAQINLALLYSSKDKSLHNKEKALHWFNEAASHGSVLAKYELGKYELLNKNYEKAFEYFDEAVTGGNTDAMIMLAMMFEQGIATEQSSDKSLKLLTLAYQKGNKKAGHYLKAFKTQNIKKSQPDSSK